MRNSTRASLTAALCLTLIAASGVSVRAAQPRAGTVISSIKANCAVAVTNREAALQLDAGLLNNSQAITSAHRSTLLALVASDESGLNALNAKIQADTTAAQATEDCLGIVTTYRVYVLVGPQVNLTLAADIESQVITEITTVSAELQVAITDSSAAPAAKASAAASMASVAALATASQSTVDQESSAVLALTPADYTGDVATLESARSNLLAVRGNLAPALNDISAALTDIGE